MKRHTLNNALWRDNLNHLFHKSLLILRLIRVWSFRVSGHPVSACGFQDPRIRLAWCLSKLLLKTTFTVELSHDKHCKRNKRIQATGVWKSVQQSIALQEIRSFPHAAFTAFVSQLLLEFSQSYSIFPAFSFMKQMRWTFQCQWTQISQSTLPQMWAPYHKLTYFCLCKKYYKQRCCHVNIHENSRYHWNWNINICVWSSSSADIWCWLVPHHTRCI